MSTVIIITLDDDRQIGVRVEGTLNDPEVTWVAERVRWRTAWGPPLPLYTEDGLRVSPAPAEPVGSTGTPGAFYFVRYEEGGR